MQQLISWVMLFISNIATIMDNSLRIQNVVSFQEIPDSVLDSGQLSLERITSIEFKNISFQYPYTTEYALRNFSYTIKAGEKIAVVGVNGSGKSTLIKLLLRFYDPTEGAIMLNGIDMRQYTLCSLRNAFSAYLQNSPNFSFTLKENLQISDLENDDSNALLYAMKKCSCDEIVNKSFNGLDTYISKIFDEKGLELSGGEHQRIALARTFFRERQMLILDEPTSALDPEVEKNLFATLKSLPADGILLITSHKLSNISLADIILVLEHGKLIEVGSEKELMSYASRFREIYSYQANPRSNTI